MRNIFFIIAVLLLLIDKSSFSQSIADSNHLEIGLCVPILYYITDDKDFSPLLSFKAIHNKNVFRTGLLYDLSLKHPLKDYSYFIFNVGYERRFLKKRSKLIVGIDLCYLHRYVNSDEDTTSTTSYHIGAGPTIGYLYKLSNRFSLQTEITCFYGYGQSTHNDKGTISTYDKGGYWTLYKGPFAISIYYNFK